MRLELVFVGDELLDDLGGVQPVYLGEMLREMHADARAAGSTVGRMTLVGDGDGELGGALRDASARQAPLVLVFGGLGPTHDDRTRDEAAAVIGQGPPEVHPDAMAWMLERFSTRGVPPPQAGSLQSRMAMCPPGARPIRNVAGMAAGFRFRLGASTDVWCLPGVTIEALPMWRAHVLPELQTASASVGGTGEGAGVRLTVVVRGLREGEVAPVVEDVLRSHPGIRAGVYLSELDGERFLAVRVVLRGEGAQVDGAARELATALAAVPGASVEPPPSGGAGGTP